ncbi:MAG: hypothetical protein QW688_07325 [Thermoprotei archaeon]
MSKPVFLPKTDPPSLAQPYYTFSVPEARPFVTVAQDPQHGDFGPFTPNTLTSGLQEAINYVAGLGGGTIYIKEGTYLVNYPIFITSSNIELRGSGMFTTKIQMGPNAQTPFPFNPMIMVGYNVNQQFFQVSDITVRDLNIDPLPLGSTSTLTWIGVALVGVSRAHLENLHTSSPGIFSILIECSVGPNGANLEHVVINNIVNTGLGATLYLGDVFPGVTVSSPGNTRNVQVSNIIDYVNASSGDDRIAIFAGNNTLTQHVQLNDILVYIDTNGSGVNGVKFDPHGSGHITDVIVQNYEFFNYGPFQSGATFPIITQNTGATSSSVTSVENIIFRDCIFYGANNISVPLFQTGNGYIYTQPFCIFDGVYSLHNQATNLEGTYILSNPSPPQSGVTEYITIKNGVVERSAPFTGAADSVLMFFSSSTVNFGGFVTIDNVVTHNVASFGNPYPPIYSYQVNLNPQNIMVRNLRGTNQPLAAPTISANPPASGTVYQNTNGYPIKILLPAYATTSGTAGTVAIALGASSTPSTITTVQVPGTTSSSATELITLDVPSGWYYSFTASGVTFATATVLPIL